MPRDASETKGRLVRAGEQLFATHGVDGARAADINKAAGQSNESALHYHFGSRQGLLVEIFRKHLMLTEPARQVAYDSIVASGQTRDQRALVRALVAPDAERLHTEDGRDYLRIIAQLAGRAGVQQGAARLPVEQAALAELLDLLMQAVALHVDEPMARERVAAAIGFLTFALADRARRIGEGDTPLLDHDAFVTDLVAMLVGALTASSR